MVWRLLTSPYSNLLQRSSGCGRHDYGGWKRVRVALRHITSFCRAGSAGILPPILARVLIDITHDDVVNEESDESQTSSQDTFAYLPIPQTTMFSRNLKKLARNPILGARRHHGQGNGGLPTHFTLNSGDKIPSVGLGVWRAGKGEVGGAVKAALNAGYRHIDGAWIYRNEEEVGKALKDSGVARDQIWLTSKLWNSFHAPEDVEATLDDSLLKLGTDYLDLYLVHWPLALKKGSKKYDKELTDNQYPTWQKLEEMVEKGKIRNIGVSNFTIPKIEALRWNPLKIDPAVNQIELNYWFPQPDMLQWSKETGILLQAYSPLGSVGRVSESLNVPVVKEIAKVLKITPAQVLISWHVQRGTVVPPKSVTPSRIEENVHLTKLPDELFRKLEDAAMSHKPERGLNPSKEWGLDFDIFA
ncbi:hypothetical protein V5O48_007970 [Marasmius crinis-equi]|uniref:NADP-dependent oxidoreductase domain-containing protein n=1 Tax=Marasmius crinis-equi TaxID=585013 RepID=A0ABR3FFC5_9AGAR